MDVFVCHQEYRGCGYVGLGEEWEQKESNMLACPVCKKDCALRITEETYPYMVSEENYKRAKELLMIK